MAKDIVPTCQFGGAVPEKHRQTTNEDVRGTAETLKTVGLESDQEEGHNRGGKTECDTTQNGRQSIIPTEVVLRYDKQSDPPTPPKSEHRSDDQGGPPGP